MAISPKPKNRAKAGTDEVDVEALIERGGSVAGASTKNAPKKPEKQVAAVVLRIPQPLLDQIEVSLKQRTVRVPRHTWLIEAIVEKVEREQATRGRTEE